MLLTHCKKHFYENMLRTFKNIGKSHLEIMSGCVSVRFVGSSTISIGLKFVKNVELSVTSVCFNSHKSCSAFIFSRKVFSHSDLGKFFGS